MGETIISLKDLAEGGVKTFSPQDIKRAQDFIVSEVNKRYPDVKLAFKYESLPEIFKQAGVKAPEVLHMGAVQDPDTRRYIVEITKIILGYLDLPYMTDSLGFDEKGYRRVVRKMFVGPEAPFSKDEKVLFNEAFLAKLRGNAINLATSFDSIGLIVDAYMEDANLQHFPKVVKAYRAFSQALSQVPAGESLNKFQYEQLPFESKHQVVDALKKTLPVLVVKLEEWLVAIAQEKGLKF